MKYVFVAEASDDGYEGYAPDFPWCEYPGRTAAEALQEAVDAIEFHLRGLLEDGDPIPEPSAQLADIDVSVPTSIMPTGTTTYRVVIEQAPRNYCAFAPDLLGCVAAANTMPEMLAMIKEAMEFHIEFMVECGDPIPPKTSIVEIIKLDIPQPAPAAELAD